VARGPLETLIQSKQNIFKRPSAASCQKYLQAEGNDVWWLERFRCQRKKKNKDLLVVPVTVSDERTILALDSILQLIGFRFLTDCDSERFLLLASG
jgi:hypothetical protein